VPGVVIYDLASRQYKRISDKGTGPTWMLDNRHLFYSHNSKIYLIDSQTKTVRELRLSPGELVDNPVPPLTGVICTTPWKTTRKHLVDHIEITAN
jgi:hypothetical protein